MAFGVIQRRTGELPVEVTGFVGRRAELARLEQLLGHARLVTVAGPGGVGKTRVALRAAARAGGRYAHGVHLAELTGLRDPELLPHTLATCLGLPEPGSRSQLDVLLDHLRDREVLLILDTCEHLVDACAMLADILLRETRGVSVLATSRQPLDVPGEYTCTVPPLPVPGRRAPGAGEAGGAGQSGDAADGAAGDAVELFAQRAAAVLPGFTVTEGNRSDVVKLCRRLDGIPLAIELAAVRLRAVPLSQLIERLEDRFRLLAGGRRTALPRHQTLRTAIDWSYGLCGERERLLWARLSVFAGAFDVSAAEEVCGGGELRREDVLETLINLVDKSVVLRVGDADGGNRYHLLDTLREYGAERAAERGEEEAARRRHIARYVRLADRFGARFLADDQLPFFRALRREHGEIRAALEYALALPDGDRQAARLAGELWGYWMVAGRQTEGRHWQTRVLERFPGPSPERIRALATRGFLTAFQRDYAGATADLTEAGQLDPDGSDPHAARAYGFLQLTLASSGRREESAVAAAEAERRMRALGDETGLTMLDGTRGYFFLLEGDPERCLEYCRRSQERLGEHSGEHWLRGYLFFVTGMAHHSTGGYEAGAADLCRALRLQHELGDPVGTAYVLEGLGWLAAAREQYERAAWLLGAAAECWRSAGSARSRGSAPEGHHRRAAAAAREALGQERYGMLRQRGAAAPLEDVVAFALSTDRLMPSPRRGERGRKGERGRRGEGTEPRAGARGRTGGPEGAPDGPRGSRGLLETLTRREREVAALVSQGLSNREIANRFVLSKRTVDAHLEHILAKCGATSRTEIAALLAAGSPPEEG